MKAYRIVWEDSAGPLGGVWHDEDEDVDTVTVTTVGYLVKKTKRRIVIAHSRHDGGQLGGVLAIPRSAVRSMKRLR